MWVGGLRHLSEGDTVWQHSAFFRNGCPNRTNVAGGTTGTAGDVEQGHTSESQGGRRCFPLVRVQHHHMDGGAGYVNDFAKTGTRRAEGTRERAVDLGLTEHSPLHALSL